MIRVDQASDTLGVNRDVVEAAPTVIVVPNKVESRAVDAADSVPAFGKTARVPVSQVSHPVNRRLIAGSQDYAIKLPVRAIGKLYAVVREACDFPQERDCAGTYRVGELQAD